MRDEVLQVSFADLELMNQGIEMDPVLKQVSAYVDQHPELVQAVDQRLREGMKKSRTGRRGLSAAQVLRNASAMRLHSGSSLVLIATRCLAIRHSTAATTA